MFIRGSKNAVTKHMVAALLGEHARVWMLSCQWYGEENEGPGFPTFLASGRVRWRVREFPGWPAVLVYCIESAAGPELGTS